MAMYCYTTEKTAGADITVERVFPMGDAPWTFTEGGDTFHRDIAAEHGEAVDGRGSSGDQCWPQKSDAMGCHPGQIAETQATLKQHGVDTEFTPDGRAILRSRSHRKAHADVFGYFDKDGGYGDPQGR